MCLTKCEGCEESMGRGCDCPDIIWDICPECEWKEEDLDECSCHQDEKDIHCRWCYG